MLLLDHRLSSVILPSQEDTVKPLQEYIATLPRELQDDPVFASLCYRGLQTVKFDTQEDITNFWKQVYSTTDHFRQRHGLQQSITEVQEHLDASPFTIPSDDTTTPASHNSDIDEDGPNYRIFRLIQQTLCLTFLQRMVGYTLRTILSFWILLHFILPLRAFHPLEAHQDGIISNLTRRNPAKRL